MTDETVDCFNCGRANPEWAQVCRSCGVVLRHGQARIVPTGRYPTDRDSLISLGAVIGTILAALVLGLFVSSLNPIDPTVGAAPTPTPSATATPTEVPSVAPSASTSVAPVPSPTPALPGTIVFGSELDANQQVVGAGRRRSRRARPSPTPITIHAAVRRRRHRRTRSSASTTTAPTATRSSLPRGNPARRRSRPRPRSASWPATRATSWATGARDCTRWRIYVRARSSSRRAVPPTPRAEPLPYPSRPAISAHASAYRRARTGR